MADVVGAIVAEVRANTAQFRRAMKGVRGELRNIGGAVETLGATMAGISIPLALMGRQATKAFAGLETAVVNAQTLTGATGKEFQDMQRDMSRFATKLSTELGISADQIATGFYDVLSAGTESMTPQFQGLAEAALTMAKVVGLEPALAIERLSDTLNSFGIDVSEANRAADVFFTTSKLAATTVPQLTEAMREAAPAAKSAGVSLEETSAILGAFASRGIKGAKAGTAFRMIISRLAAPTGATAQALEDLGVQVFDATGKMRPIMDILEDMQRGMSGLTDETQAAALKAIAGEEGFAKLAGLLQSNIGTLRDWTGELEKGGQLQAGLTAKMNTFGERMGLVKIRLENASRILGRELAPHIEEVAAKVVGAVKWFTKLDPAIHAAAVSAGVMVVKLTAAGGALAIFGRIVAPVAGAVATLASSFVRLGLAAVKSVVPALKAVRAVMVSLTLASLPLIGTAAAVAAGLAGVVMLVGAGSQLWKAAGDDIKNFFVGALEWVKSATESVLDSLGDLFKGLDDFITKARDAGMVELFDKHRGDARALAKEIETHLMSKTGAALIAFDPDRAEKLRVLAGELRSHASSFERGLINEEQLRKRIQMVKKEFLGTGQSVFEGIFSGAEQGLSDTVGKLKEVSSSAGEAFSEFLSNIGGDLKKSFAEGMKALGLDDAGAFLKELAGEGLGALKDLWGEGSEKFKDLVASLEQLQHEMDKATLGVSRANEREDAAPGGAGGGGGRGIFTELDLFLESLGKAFEKLRAGMTRVIDSLGSIPGVGTAAGIAGGTMSALANQSQLGGIIEGAQSGGVAGGVVAALSQSKQFAQLVEILNGAVQGLADALGAALEPLIPAFEALAPALQALGMIVGAVLTPIFQVLAPIIEGLARVIFEVSKFFASIFDPGGELANSTFEEWMARKKATQATKDQTEAARRATAAMSNVPRGIKVALHRWNALADETLSAAAAAAAGGGSGGGDSDFSSGCFVPGTLVMMASGVHKPIEEITTGERVRTIGGDGSLHVGTVVATMTRHRVARSRVVVVGADRIQCTEEHPWWVAGNPDRPEAEAPSIDAAPGGRWVRAEDLQAGDRVACLDFRLRPIAAVEEQRYEGPVHNLTIGEVGTYLVGTAGVLVHNVKSRRRDGFALGAVFRKPTVGLFAEAGPEIVSPVDKFYDAIHRTAAAMAGGGGGGDVYNVHVHGVTDPAAVAAEVERRLRRQRVARTGTPVQTVPRFVPGGTS